MSEFQNTCILYFTTGKTGDKSFSLKKKKNSAIQRTLFDKTLAEVRRSGIAHIISDGKDFEPTFEGKIKSAVDVVFRKGYHNIIIVGDDTPQLSSQTLRLAAHQLEKSEISVGPSTDGGSYLIAFSKIHFDKGILNNLLWQTSDFYQSLKKQLELSGLNISVLPTLSDIDHSGDLYEFLLKSTLGKFSSILKCILCDRFYSIFRSKVTEHVTVFRLQDRGPPQLHVLCS